MRKMYGIVPGPRAKGRYFGLAVVTVIGTSFCTAACGSQGANVAQMPNNDAGHVATAFLDDMFSSRFAAARSFVAPASKGIFDTATRGLAAAKASTKNLHVGRVYRNGASASVIFVGSICPPKHRSGTGCITNRSVARSANPAFRVLLSKSRNGWLVDLGTPGPVPAPAASPSGENSGGS